MKIFLCLSLLSLPAVAFVPAVGWKTRSFASQNQRLFSEIVDADFERSEAENDVDNDDDESTADAADDVIPVLKSNSILDMTIEGNNITFPFIESSSQQTINCRIAISATLDDEQTYAVGIPAQHGVLMVIERGENDMEYMSPDDDENVEVLEIMAGALEKYLSEDLKLQRTPRVLTIAGDLDKYVNDFPANLVSEEITMEKIMEEPDTEDLDSIFDFFKEQLGEEAFEHELEESKTKSLPEELQGFFEMMSEDEINEDLGSPEKYEEAFRKLGDDLQHEGVGVKLVGFQVNNKDEKDDKNYGGPPSFYSLVKPLKPLTVVGRLREQTDGTTEQTVFELLTPEEESLIVPRLEQVCKEDIEAQGLTVPRPTVKP